VAVAVTDVSATDVAVMITVLGEGTVEGAVYTPEVEPMVPMPVSVVESDHVTFWQVGFEVMLQPGLFTVAAKRKVSPVPTVAEVGFSEMLIPVTMVKVAVPVLVVSACEVPVIVTTGAIVAVPLTVTDGIVRGAVYSPVASMEPQFVARTLLIVSQVKLQVIAVLVLPVTRPLKSWVLLVITLAEVGDIVMLTVEELLPPQPNAPSVATRVSIVESFHRFIPVLQKFRDIRTGSTNTFTRRLPGPLIPEPLR
jgi:hypothetical protein